MEREPVEPHTHTHTQQAKSARFILERKEIYYFLVRSVREMDTHARSLNRDDDIRQFTSDTLRLRNSYV